MAYLKRRENRLRLAPVQLLARDIDQMHVRHIVEQIVWDLLRRAGLVSTPAPPPAPPQPARKKPDLRVVPPDKPTG